ncbi:MAG: hypothetical protein K9M49_08905 [Candidatus Marinimicrobia bacterium]|nr:hypothetical protein [Candidatus Neomarinimicrobiota bacterium]MCF7850429.1 hypothetical protein [Candidatus Neomarinimicrobiota bacterium]MCF7905254.1 hypothetical protein [Candidatus Neomarinimicrobiota bacterium]
MRILAIILLSLVLFIGCESPVETENDQNLYKGETVELGKAPFLLNTSLAKKSDGVVVISENTSDGTVFGLQADAAVYDAEGGEVLPTETWIGNQFDEPVEVILGSSLVLTFDEPTLVTLLDANQVSYINENGELQKFNGSGVITATQIFTAKVWSEGLGKSSSNSSTTIITNATFGIGGDGGENG